MPTYKIRGINVDFPYEAYDCQVVYMEKVIQSLQERSNALLESPTGTGKTLCLLCATLAWRKSLGEFSTFKGERRGQNAGGLSSDTSSSQSESSLPSIVYTSRTHSQLRQVIQELKRTSYRPKMVVLGSREQLCIHEEVSLLRGRTQTNACHSLCKKRKKRYCAHFPRVAEFMKANPGLGDEPIDIEELINIGKSCGPCPYYMSRELHKAADIVFAPYNYLIDPGNRKSLSINWNDSVLIFDEAHNLEGLCADAASFDMPSSLLTACISEAKNCVDLSTVRRDTSNDNSYNPENFAILRALLLKIEKRISELHIESKELGLTKPGPYIYELLAELNITYETATSLMNIIEGAVLLLEEDSNGADSQGRNKMKPTVCRLESMGDILKIIFRDGGRAHADYYRFHVQEVEANAAATFKGRAGRTLSWWCFNPGLAMEEFSKMGVRSIILTSGTLSPMDSFAHEFKLDFPVRLENPHVISASQIWAGVVPVGPSGYSFNSSYRTRDSLEYKMELGNAIVNFSRIVPDGLLVFFPSYYLLERCIECWKNQIPSKSTNASTIWERICKNKQPVVEPRQSSLFALSIDDYMSKLKDSSTSGAVFFAVCRGKVSEGLDFADHAGRAVIVTGMPFAMRTDPKVRLKREYLDQQTQSRQAGSKILTGEEWYGQQASRAVNQAVGRVIRHRHDYGAIIFCDERFAQSNRQSQISLWIQPHIKCYSKFGDIVFTLTRFFRDGATRGPTKMEQMRIQDGLGKGSESKPLVKVEKLEVDDYLAPLTEPIGSLCNLKSLTSMSELKDSSGKWKEIVPANRSSLVSQKNTQNLISKRTAELLYKEDKESAVGGDSSFCCLNNSNLSKDGETKQSLIAQCSLKKPKRVFSPTELYVKSYDPSAVVRQAEIDRALSIYDSCNDNVLTGSNNCSSQNAQAGSTVLLGDLKSAERESQTLSQNHTGASSSPIHRSTEERQGSDFLCQVKEKLDHDEYKEFVGFMEALKSKAMKIGPVLQSIVNLFCTPDRLPLLQRFKDYIPTKHHKYLTRSDDTVGK